MSAQRILILEDDASVANAYARALRSDGNQVTVCTKFEDARRQLTAGKHDAVLTDVRVGPYNGIQLAHLFRTLSPAGSVVVITGYDDVMLRREVHRLNGEFIVKPISATELRQAFQRQN
jgi:DNA-binding NtrC family response regulator